MPLSGLPLVNRQQKRKFIRDFVEIERKNRLDYFREHSSIFFMLQEFPENRERFDVPNSFSKLQKKYQNVVFV